MTVGVPILRPIPTLMKSWGDWFGIFATAIGGVGTAALILRGRRRAVSAG